MSSEVQKSKEDVKSKYFGDTTSPISSPVFKSRKSIGFSTGTFRHLRFGSVLRTWTEISKINFLSTISLDDSPKGIVFLTLNYN